MDTVSPKKSITRILPDNVNSKSHTTTGLLSVTGMGTSQDIDVTPQPTERTAPLTVRSGSANATNRRDDGESDPARTKQITALAKRGLSKQSSSFVEDLANATDTALRSGSEMSFKNTPSPPSKKIERSLAAGSGLGQVSEQAEGADLDEPLDDRRKREVKFTPSSTTSPVNTNGQDRYEDGVSDNEASIELDMDDLGSLAGSRGMENAFKSLENFNFGKFYGCCERRLFIFDSMAIL